MKKTLTLITLVQFIICGNSFPQCLQQELSLDKRVTSSDLVIEGKVVSQKSYWDAPHKIIYTSSSVEIYKIFKGTTASSTVEILSPGGTIGDDRLTVEPSFDLSIGDIGIFTCIPNMRYVLSPAHQGLSGKYETYGYTQGFLKYDLVNGTARDAFKTYSNVKGILYSNISFLCNFVKVKELVPFDITSAGASTNLYKMTAPVITGFSPASLTAGTGDQLTINGSGFGISPGTVGFKDADNGGAGYMNPSSYHYVSWTDTKIVIRVPARAGTGTIQVTQGATATSAATLTITYAQINAVNVSDTNAIDLIDDNGNGGYTFQMYTGFDASSAKAPFMRAFDTWRCNTNVNWNIGTTTATNVCANDGINVIRFDIGAELPAGVLGICYYWWSVCGGGKYYVADCDIAFDDGTNWNYGSGATNGVKIDFETVALHELGHAIMCGHVINTADFMHSSTATATDIRSLNANNLACGNLTVANSIVANSCGPAPMRTAVAVTPVTASICNGGSVALTGSGADTYTWSPTATLSSSTGATVTASPLVTTTYTVSGVTAGCTRSKTVTVNVASPPSVANAGPDQVLCGSSATLGANTPVVGTGSWTVVSGPGTIVTPLAPTSAVNSITAGSSLTLRWTITNCASSTFDDVVITNAAVTVANAGTDQSFCGGSNSGTLNGNSPGAGNTGTWSLLAGTASITTPSSYNSGVTGLGIGTATLQWSITNGSCTSSDNVDITYAVLSPLVFTVSNTADAGAGSLRQAIIDANSNCGHDTIKFNLGAGGPFSINLTSALPALTDNSGTTIDGWSNGVNPGIPNTILMSNISAGSPMNPAYRVKLNNSTGSVATGLVITSSGNRIKGLVIPNFGSVAGSPTNKGISNTGNNNIVTGCYIGLDETGSTTAKTFSGITVSGSNNTIGDGTPGGINVISGNANGAGAWSGGLYLSAGGSNQIKGNIIGAKPDGTSQAASLQLNGIYVTCASNTIGGSTPGERNIITCNASTGIYLSGINGKFNKIVGNYIGLTADGSSAPANQQTNGILIAANASSNSIGGSVAGEGNAISCNGLGISAQTNCNSQLIMGNILGLKADGSTKTSSTQTIGIMIKSNNNTIGGNNTTNERNIISGNWQGVKIDGEFSSPSGNLLKGNYIGTDVSGTINLGNNDAGIYLYGNAINSTIGGIVMGDGNIIAYNGNAGISVDDAASDFNLIRRNSIFCNTGPGIDLHYGVTDGNDGYPRPVIGSANNSGVSGTSSPNATIEIFYNHTCGADAEGVTYITTVVADGAGSWSYSGTLTGTVTATATSASNNTSEFAIEAVLPVELLSFTANLLNNGDVLTKWVTASEINNDLFTVERSMDGVSFEPIGTVKGAGNSSAVNSYEFTDLTPLYPPYRGESPKGWGVYYRLKQTDYDGSYKYTATASVRMHPLTAYYSLYPNPASEKIAIEYFPDHTGETRIEIVDVLGRTVKRFTIIAKDGMNLADISVRDLEDGTYSVVLRSGSDQTTLRFTKKN